MSARDELSDLWWPECSPLEVHCEACGVWLGYNYPADLCMECAPPAISPGDAS